MKSKEYYLAKIATAKTNIEKWELAIKALDNPIVNINNSEPTKVISMRVPTSKAIAIKKEFIKYILDNSKSF